MAQKYKREVYKDGRIIYSNLVNDIGVPFLGQNKTIEAKVVTKYWDGSDMNDAKVDNKLYSKIGNEFIEFLLPNWGDNFLEKDTMAQVRNMEPWEILLIKRGYFKGVKLNGYYIKNDTPYPIEYYLSDTPNLDNGGSVIVVGNIKLEHKFGAYVHVIHFGITGTVEDNSERFTKLSEYISNGQIIRFNPETYLGNFVLDGKSSEIELNNSKITPKVTGVGGLVVKGSLGGDKIVSGNPTFNATSFTLLNVEDALDLSEGDIIQLRDEAIRTSDSAPNQNLELVKVKAVEGNVVRIVGTLRSTLNTGTVRARKVNTVKNVKITGATFVDNPTNTQPLLWIRYAENVIVNNIRVNDFYGNAVRFDSVYSGQITNMYTLNPRGTGSGEGYGVAVNECKNLFLNNIHGNGTRHLVDFKCSYDCHLKTFFELNAIEAAVMVCHNGFGGFITVEDGVTAGLSYAVATHNQGFVGQPNESVQVHRGYVIKNIKHIWKGKETNQSITGISILGDYADIVIKGVTCTYDGDTTVSTLTLSASVVQIIGNKKGFIVVEDIRTDVIGSIIRDQVRTNTTSVRTFPSYYNSLYANRALNPIRVEGNGNIFIDGVFVNTLDDALLRLNKNTALYPNYITISEKGLDWTLRSATSKLLSDASTMDTEMIKGSFPLLTATSGSNVSVTNDFTVPRNRIFTSGKYLPLSATINTNVTLNATTPFETGLWEGQMMNVVIRGAGATSETGTITIPSGSTTVENASPIVMKAGYIYTFSFYGGKWRLVSDWAKSSAVTSATGSLPSAFVPSVATDVDGLKEDLNTLGAIVNDLRTYSSNNRTVLNNKLASDRASGQQAS